MGLNRRLVALALAWASAGVVFAAEPAPESTLRLQLQSATWPADIVRLAAEYRQRYPRGEFRPVADTLAARAGSAVQALEQRDVRLFRSAFSLWSDKAELRDDLRRAALADPQAALRIAHAHRSGDGVPADANRYVGWLQYAAKLGNEDASYELALHYRRDAQPIMAARYEARAVELGYVLPRDLDHFRK